MPLTISAQDGLIDQQTFFDKQVASRDMSNYFLLLNGDFAYNKSYSNDYPWGAVKRLDKYKNGALSSLYICFRPIEEISSDFIRHYFETSKWHKEISMIAGEGARNHGLLNMAVEDFLQTQHFLPFRLEQNKIATLLNLITKRIETQSQIIKDLKALKAKTRKHLFSKLVETELEEKQIGELLDYEQPTSYIVNSTEYSNANSTPVLTANKAFILGYTDEIFGVFNKGDCIIFDDFTMDMKYVNFPFKVKSSAIKILTAKNNINLLFIFEYLINLGLISREHKRHYISEIEIMYISIPTFDIQAKIASTLQSLDTKVENESKILEKYHKQKKYLLSKLFI